MTATPEQVKHYEEIAREAGVDAFVLRHLDEYVDSVLYNDEADAFTVWARAVLRDDPTLADIGWPHLYQSWCYRWDVCSVPCDHDECRQGRMARPAA